MKAAKETAEPTKAESKDVAPQAEKTSMTVVDQQSQGIPGLVPSDIIVPKLLLMQGMSELMKDARKHNIQIGDIVRSTNVQKLGDPEHGVDFIPLSFPQGYWVIEVKKTDAPDAKFEYKRMIPRDARNSGLQWNFWSDKDGNEVASGDQPRPVGSFAARRVQRLAMYALLPGDIAADAAEKKKAASGEFPDFSKALMPILIAFRSFSFPAGKEVVSFFTQVKSFNRQAWEAILTLKCHMETNEKGSFYVFDVDRSKPRPVSKEDLGVVKYWAGIVATSELRVDESQDEDSASSGGAPGGGNF